MHGFEVENDVVVSPANDRNHSTNHRIQNKVIRRRNDRQEHGHGPQGRDEAERAVGREAADGPCEEQGGAAVKTRHSRNRELELVVSPRVPSSLRAVQNVDESVFGRQQSGWHAAPRGDDDEGDDVVHGDRSANSLERARRQEGVRVNDEADAEADV